MSDLTYCYLHMSNQDLLIFETFNDSLAANYLSGELSDEELEIPAYMVPPNPDDSDILPSQVHPSYPYGNPTNIKHPAARPRAPHDPGSRALFEDMTYAGGGLNGALRWKDLALDSLLPIDHDKEEAERAAQARKMASGAAQNNGPPAQRAGEAQAPGDQTIDEDDEDDDEDDDDGEDDEDDEDDEDEDMQFGSPENFDVSLEDM